MNIYLQAIMKVREQARGCFLDCHPSHDEA